MTLQLDVEGAIEKVEEYLEIWKTCESAYRRRVDQTSYLRDSAYSEGLAKLEARIGLVEQIAGRVDERLAAGLRSGAKYTWRYGGQDSVLHELLGRLQGVEEEERILSIAGPKLAAANLHAWVWSAAAALWGKGERNAAITAAAKSIFDVQLPLKLKHPNASLTGTGLVTVAFNPKPSSLTEPRLRVTVVPRSDGSWGDAQEGAFNFGRGVCQGIRNLFAHGLDEPEEQEALEPLAALSLLARWIDGADRVDDGS